MKNIALVVTYNPKINELKESLERIKKEVNSIILVNNSENELEVEMEGLECINLGENKGIARAQTIGMKRAFEDYNAETIFQFDQDSLMDIGMIEQLKKTYNELKKNGIEAIVGPQDYDKDTLEYTKSREIKGKEICKNEEVVEVKKIISSGCLISRDTYEKIGGMKDELFIDIVDFEYCWRARKNGIKIYKDKKAKLAHKLGVGKTKSRIGIKFELCSPFRHYYAFRNILYCSKLEYVPLEWKVMSIIELIYKFLFFKFLFSDGNERFKYMKMGIKDFYLGKMGKMD